MTTELAQTADLVTALAHLPKEMQQKILANSQKIQQGSSSTAKKIRLDAKSYTMPDGTETQSFSGIVVATKHANIWFEHDYDESNIQAPACIAVGDDACKDLTPHENVVNAPGTLCGSCPKFQWGSANRGRGKACTEQVLMAVYVPSISDELMIIEEKKGNARTADNYLANVSNKFGHPIAVMTEFTIGATNKWEQTFKATTPVSPDLVTSLAERFDEAERILTSKVVDSYVPPEDKQEPAQETTATNHRVAR